MLGGMQSNVLDFVKLCTSRALYFPKVHRPISFWEDFSETSNSFCILFITFIRNYTNMPACSYLEDDYETENSRTLCSSSFLPFSKGGKSLPATALCKTKK